MKKPTPEFVAGALLTWMIMALIGCCIQIYQLREDNAVLRDQLHQMIEKGIRLP